MDGQMPDLVVDSGGNLHLVSGLGDSILYTLSTDHGQSFSGLELVDTLSGLFSFATRGTQIAMQGDTPVLIACTTAGNMYSYYHNKNHWVKGAQVNDADTIAKEGLLSVSANKDYVYAVWLDLRDNNKNKIYGARSDDAGRTWSTNQLIYTSPDSSVCDCCKPTVAVYNDQVVVMFRNWIDGNRDMYIISSADGGKTFGAPQQLGESSWPLDGCPMAGGDMLIQPDGIPQTIWKRKSTIYAQSPGSPEIVIGNGRDCRIALAGTKPIYCWVDKNEIHFKNAAGEEQVVAQGKNPVLQVISSKKAICVWEQDKEIRYQLLAL